LIAMMLLLTTSAPISYLLVGHSRGDPVPTSQVSSITTL